VQGSPHHTGRQIVHTVAFLDAKVIGLERVKVGDREGSRFWRLAMFKLPSFDPVSIAVMGFGILLVAALALTLG
jgi:hypothetical protein